MTEKRLILKDQRAISAGFFHYIFIALLALIILPSSCGAFSFAPPREPESSTTTKQDQSKDVNSNTKIQLSAISSIEDKIKTNISPKIMSYFYTLDVSRKDMAVNFLLQKNKAEKNSAMFYVYTALEFVFSHSYVAYGLLALSILFLIRLILLRFNFTV